MDCWESFDCLRKMRLASEPTAKVTMEPMRTYQVKAIVRERQEPLGFGTSNVPSACAMFGIKLPLQKTCPGICQSATFRAKPTIMPMMAPVCVAYFVRVPRRKTPSKRSIRDGGDGEADLYDVALASDADAVDGDGEENEAPT